MTISAPSGIDPTTGIPWPWQTTDKWPLPPAPASCRSCRTETTDRGIARFDHQPEVCTPDDPGDGDDSWAYRFPDEAGVDRCTQCGSTVKPIEVVCTNGAEHLCVLCYSDRRHGQGVLF